MRLKYRIGGVEIIVTESHAVKNLLPKTQATTLPENTPVIEKCTNQYFKDLFRDLALEAWRFVLNWFSSN